MPKMTITVPHQLSAAEATERMKGLLESVKAKYGDQVSDLQENWTENGGTFSFKAMGFKISGDLTLTDSEMVLNGDYPLAARPFKGKIEGIVKEKATALLA